MSGSGREGGVGEGASPTSLGGAAVRSSMNGGGGGAGAPGEGGGGSLLRLLPDHLVRAEADGALASEQLACHQV